MTGVITVLYVTNVQRFTIKQYGTLVGIQMLTSILVYLPAGRLADRFGRRPFVIAIFDFALFPLALIAAPSLHITLAFIVGGLRETGEPARKAIIIDFAQDNSALVRSDCITS